MYSGGRFSEAAKIGNDYYLNWKKRQEGLTKSELVAGWKQFKKDNIEEIRSARQRLLRNIKESTGKKKKIDKGTKQQIKDYFLENNDDYNIRYNSYGKNEGIGRDEELKNLDKNDGVLSRNMREQMKILRRMTLNNTGFEYGIDYNNIYNNALMNVRSFKQLLLNKEYGTTLSGKPYKIATINNEEKSVITNVIHINIMNNIDSLAFFENLSVGNFDQNFNFFQLH